MMTLETTGPAFGEAFAAADEVHQGSALLDQVESRLDQAAQHSGRIAWHEVPHAPSPMTERLASRLGGLSDPFIRHDSSPGSR